MLSLFAFVGIMVAASSVHAATVFSDDFEDGDYTGWLLTSIGNGLSSAGVETNNGSLMAVVRKTGVTRWSLSRAFSYSSDQSVAFTMQAIANSRTLTGGSILHAASGVEISFLDGLNSTLGSVTIASSTNTGFLNPDSLVGTTQLDYDVSMSVLTTLAGLGAADPIANYVLSFFASADTFGNVGGVANSSSTVWFDNVTVSSVNPVPIPAAALLFASALGVFGYLGKRKGNA